MGEDAIERSRNMVEIERLHEQAGVANLAASAAAHEPPKLLLGGAVAPRRHLLERSKPAEVVVGVEDLFDARRAERTDQLLLEIRDADVEPEVLHVRTRELGAETGALERLSEDSLLARIAKTREARSILLCNEVLEERPDAMCASEALDPNARGRKVQAAPLGERFDCDLVTLPFDDHD
jgi:hypothetical protein